MANKKQKRVIDNEVDSQNAMNKALKYPVAEEVYMCGQLKVYLKVC